MGVDLLLQLLVIVRPHRSLPDGQRTVARYQSDPICWLRPTADSILDVFGNVPDHDPVRERSDFTRLKLILAECIHVEETLARNILPQAFEVTSTHPLLHPGEILVNIPRGKVNIVSSLSEEELRVAYGRGSTLHPKLLLVKTVLGPLTLDNEPSLEPVAGVGRVKGQYRLVRHPLLAEPCHDPQNRVLVNLLGFVKGN